MMAATRFINAHRVFAFFFHCIVSDLALYSHDLYYSSNARNPVSWKAINHADWPIPFQLITSIDRSRLAPKSILLRRGLLAWAKHGHICLAAPDFEPAFDITVCMDVAKNPGPDMETPKPLLPTVNIFEPPSLPGTCLRYTRSALFKLRGPSKTTFRTSILGELKNAGLLRHRGKRGGLSRNSRSHGTGHSSVSSMVRNESRSKIPTVATCNRWRSSRSERGQSVRVEIQRKNEPVLKTSQGGYTVPKCCFINICSLMTTKNKIKANIALETDLYAADIDICMVSETHLKKVVPDANVAIKNNTIYRTDRDWFGNDNRAKGGVAVYIRNSGNLKILDVKRSETFECIYVTMHLPSDHNMMICALYHPPKPRYMEDDLISYLTYISDLFLDGSPDGTVMIGGDLNNINFDKLSALSGLTALVDFARRGTSILDNCLTNNCSFFSKCYLFDAQIKTDHRGVIVPAGAKLKPMRYKCTMHD